MFKTLHPNRFALWFFTGVIVASLIFFWWSQLIEIEADITNHVESSTPTPESTHRGSATILDAIDTSSWKMYRNREYGFEMRYPSEWYFMSNGLPWMFFEVSREQPSKYAVGSYNPNTHCAVGIGCPIKNNSGVAVGFLKKKNSAQSLEAFIRERFRGIPPAFIGATSMSDEFPSTEFKGSIGGANTYDIYSLIHPNLILTTSAYYDSDDATGMAREIAIVHAREMLRSLKAGE